jgi:hypothetical protein
MGDRVLSVNINEEKPASQAPPKKAFNYTNVRKPSGDVRAKRPRRTIE